MMAGFYLRVCSIHPCVPFWWPAHSPPIFCWDLEFPIDSQRRNRPNQSLKRMCHYHNRLRSPHRPICPPNFGCWKLLGCLSWLWQIYLHLKFHHPIESPLQLAFGGCANGTVHATNNAPGFVQISTHWKTEKKFKQQIVPDNDSDANAKVNAAPNYRATAHIQTNQICMMTHSVSDVCMCGRDNKIQHFTWSRMSLSFSIELKSSTIFSIFSSSLSVYQRSASTG